MTSGSPPPCDAGSSCPGQLQSPSVKSVADAMKLDESVGYVETLLGGVEQGVLPTTVDTPGSHFGAYGELGGIFRGCVDSGMNVSYGGVTSCDPSGTMCVLQCPQGTTAFNADVAGTNACTDTTLLVPVNKWVASTADPYICPPSYSYYPGRPQGGPGNLFPAVPELCYRNCDGDQSLIPPLLLSRLDVAPLLTTPMLVNSDTAATNAQVADIADQTIHPIRTMINAITAYGAQHYGADIDAQNTFRLRATAIATAGLLLFGAPEPTTLTGTPPTGFTPAFAGEAAAPTAVEELAPATTGGSLPTGVIAMSNTGDKNNSGDQPGQPNTTTAGPSDPGLNPERPGGIGSWLKQKMGRSKNSLLKHVNKHTSTTRPSNRSKTNPCHRIRQRQRRLFLSISF